jgi:hypothetical protein
MNFVNRVITISYDSDEFSPTDETLKALGYLAAYGMRNSVEIDIAHVSISIRPDGEMIACYFEPWKRGDTYSENKPQYNLDAALIPFKSEQPFVLGAIKREDGTYSFHS